MKKNIIMYKITLAKDWVFRPLIILTHKYLKLSPNALTIIGIIFGFLTAVLIILDKYEFAVITGIISGVFDYIDGGVARRYSLVNRKGVLFDKYSDKALFIIIFSAILLKHLVPARVAIVLAVVILIASIMEIFTAIGAFNIIWPIPFFSETFLNFETTFKLYIVLNFFVIAGQLGYLIGGKKLFPMFKPVT